MQFVRTIMVNKSVENRANWSGGGIKWGFHWYSSEKRRWVPILFYFILFLEIVRILGPAMTPGRLAHLYVGPT